MNRVQVKLGDRSYAIDVAGGNLARVGEFLAPLARGKRVAVVTDTHVGPLYGEMVERSLVRAGFVARRFSVPAGEASKSIEQLKLLWESFVGFDMDRGSAVVALGGGVVGDLAGFAAATWMRGVLVVQVPTTLLAMVDSSVGGKTAIDLDAGKNLVGAFHQPAAVVIDPLTLRTLPERDLRGGLAEVIKHGMIRDEAFFARLESVMDDLLQLAPDVTDEVIVRNCEIKAEVVSADEREGGLRAILNYGHTVGHAIEALAGFGALSHGESVAMGMVVAGRVAERLGMCDASVRERQNALLSRAGLPLTVGDVDADRVVDLMRHDKKTRGGSLLMVLPTRMGHVERVNDVDPGVVRVALEESRG